MARRFLVLNIIIFALSMVGCTARIKYPLDGISPVQGESGHPGLRVAIAPFKDHRPEEEKNSTSSLFSEKMETRDAWFDNQDVPGGIATMIAEHFNHVRLFGESQAVGPAFSDITEDNRVKLKDQRFQAVLSGKLLHFQGAGYPTSLDRVGVALAIIPITALFTLPAMLAEKNKNEAIVEILELELTDTDTGERLWSNSYTHKIERLYKDVYPKNVVEEALKEVVGKIVDDLAQVQLARQ